MNSPQDHVSDRAVLTRIARKVMIEAGMEPDFPPQGLEELSRMTVPAGGEGVRDQRALLWCSIDNNESRDLDQLTVAEAQPDGGARILVAIADVDVLVRKDSALDGHAHRNTTSIYTPAIIFSMLPEALSTDRTSMNESVDRLALVTDMVVSAEGIVTSSEIYRALVRNQAKLAYPSVSDWLNGRGPAPAAIPRVAGLAENLQLQDAIAKKMAEQRRAHGSLSFETTEAKTVFTGESLSDLQVDQGNRAKELIEQFMLGANEAMAVFLDAQNFPSIRRVLRSPQRWDRIVQVAAGVGEHLPDEPDAPALEAFLLRRKQADPAHFGSLSLAVVKLIGRGEYALDLPGAEPPGHFGLAVKNYTHATAPNRRFPDLLTQRLVKAALAASPVPYTNDELAEIAQHCTERESAATKVERTVKKSAAALLLSHRVGEPFDAIVTGTSAKGTWVKVIHPPVEGKLARGYQGLDVGDRVQVKLVSTDVEKGFIDFALAGGAGAG